MTRSPAALRRYREKRDFSRTPEPAGNVHSPTQQLSFVVQRHAARRLHYDLRLEWHGVMKSWAVTRGPSLDPADKRLAVEVEDHPIDYASFEGTIPKPDYGGGTVQVWDRGSWAPLDPTTVDQDLAAGELKFVLAGERLSGGFVLVRMKPRRAESESHHNWLLIKERDSAATPRAGDAVLRADTSVLSGRTMDEIASADRQNEPAAAGKAAAVPRSAKRSSAAKQAGAGTSRGTSPAIRKTSAKAAAVTTDTVRKAPPRPARSPSTMPRFVAPQLCKLVDTPPIGDRWVHELKLDGYRMQLRVEAGVAVLRTRTGLDWTARFPSIAKAAAALPDCLMDGEVVALDAKGHPGFAALQATLAGEQHAPIVYFVFDLLHDGRRDLSNEPLEQRKRQLRSMVPDDATVLRYLDHFAGPGAAVLGSACELGMEGVVSKRRDGSYSSGRGDGWTKAKCHGRDEFLVGGWTRDKHGRGLGALLVGAWRDRKLLYLGRVGTGFSAVSGDDLLRRLATRRISASPFAGRQPARTSDVYWAVPELVVEVSYGGWTEAEGLLRHASFVGIRDDKPAAEVTPPENAWADPPPQPAAEATRPDAPAKPARRVALPDLRARPASRAAAKLTLSHPDRVLWPATDTTPSVTKADLATYYARFADRLLAHVGGRPLTIVRAPDGITGQLFVQRHAMRGQSPLIGTVTIVGQKQPFLRVDDAPGLTALAQISAVELHPWGARADTPDLPDRLVFDLDPAEGLGFDAVIRCAQELRERLLAVGLTSFARVTGGKGLHVVVPLTAPRRGAAPGWPEARQFAHLICATMQSDAPDRYTTTMAKQAREGKIFLDYLRNDRSATAIAAWSPRGRPGAPIARPLAWSAVKAGLDPAGWHLSTLLDASPPPDPWADFATAGGDLRAAILRATKG